MKRAAQELNTPGVYLIQMHNKGDGVYQIKIPWVSIYTKPALRCLPESAVWLNPVGLLSSPLPEVGP